MKYFGVSCLKYINAIIKNNVQEDKRNDMDVIADKYERLLLYI